jgi:hypothetical protein
MEKILDLHPLTVILVIILGAQILGVLGMIISIPVASAMKVTLQTAYRHCGALLANASATARPHLGLFDHPENRFSSAC